MIDDSIVRSTTSKRMCKTTQDAGAKKYMKFRTAFLHPCYYGTDIDSEENLIACHHNIREIEEILGVDSLGYLPIEKLGRLVEGTEYCAACFNGEYPNKYTEEIFEKIILKESYQKKSVPDRKGTVCIHNKDKLILMLRNAWFRMTTYTNMEKRSIHQVGIIIISSAYLVEV